MAIINAYTIYEELDFEYLLEEFKKEQRIRTCIRRIYEGANAQHTYDGKLGYILLIGDSKDVSNLGMPTSYDPEPGAMSGTGPYPSDYYYTCLTREDGIYDEIGELFIGRFCVDNNLLNGLTELHNMVEKTIYFESEAVFGGWRDNLGYLNGLQIDQGYIGGYYNFINNLIPDYFNITIINEFTTTNVKQQTFDALNNGVMKFSYFGHGGEHGWSVEGWLDMSVLMNELNNDFKAPVVHGISCSSGCFDNSVDCFAEGLTSYSPTQGFTGYLGSGRNIVFDKKVVISNPPDGFHKLLEYTIFNDLSHITGEYILESKIMTNSTTHYHAFNFFGDPALNIMAQGFEITHDINLPCNTTISTEIHVRDGVTLTIPFSPESCHLYFEDNGKLIIDQGATLHIQGLDAIHGKNDNNAIIVNGNIGINNIIPNIIFTAPENMHWTGLVLNNASVEQLFYNCTFERCNLKSKCRSLHINDCDFNESWLKCSKGDILIENSYFTNSSVTIIDPMYRSSSFEIKNCNFNNTTNVVRASIFFDGYPIFTINNNNISYEKYDGICLYYAGACESFTHIICNNTIQYTGTSPNLNKGVKIYCSYVDLRKNNILDSDYGVVGLNNSNIKILGTANWNYENETQRIIDNNTYQACFYNSSFPYEFHWNVIENNVNSNALIFNNEKIPQGHPLLDVTYNCWDDDFNPVTDLLPSGAYEYDPEYCGSGQSSGPVFNSAQLLYNSAKVNIQNKNYTEAESQLKQIVTDYPETEVAKTSLKELYVLEEVADSNYTELKNYYNTEPNIQNNDELSKLAGWLANYCDVKIENYQDAINWYENVIDTSESVDDSIFAIIDLGYTYLIMQGDSLNRNTNYIGKYPEHKPISKEKYVLKRDELINLLFKNSETGKTNEFDMELSDSKIITLYQNYPNPFNESSKIEFYLAEDGQVTIELYNLLGEKIQTITDKYYTKSKHKILLYSDGLKTGVYYCTVKLNGALVEGKKMIKIE